MHRKLTRDDIAWKHGQKNARSVQEETTHWHEARIKWFTFCEVTAAVERCAFNNQSPHRQDARSDTKAHSHTNKYEDEHKVSEDELDAKALVRLSHLLLCVLAAEAAARASDPPSCHF